MWVVAVAAYAPVLTALVLLVLQLEDSRTTVDGKLATAVGRPERATLPLADAATPVAGAATADRPAAQRLTAKSVALADVLAPLASDIERAKPGRQLQLVGALASDLESHGAGTQLQKAGALSDNLLGVDAGGQIQRSGDQATTFLGAGVGGAVRDVQALTRAIDATDLPRTARSLTATADELNRGTRLRRMLVRLTAVLGQAQRVHLVPSVDAAADAVTARLVPLVERGVAMLASTLDVARDTNGHAANLDRKPGGDLPLPGSPTTGPRARVPAPRSGARPTSTTGP